MAKLEVIIQEETVNKITLPVGEQQSQLLFLVQTGETDRGLALTTKSPSNYLAAIMMAGGRWVLMAPPGKDAISVNQIPMIALKVLDHRDNIDVADIRLQLIEEILEILTADTLLIRERKACPVCQKDFKVGDQVIYCPRCNLAHHTGSSLQHDDCWHYNTRCASGPFCGHIIPVDERQVGGNTDQ